MRCSVAALLQLCCSSVAALLRDTRTERALCAYVSVSRSLETAATELQQSCNRAQSALNARISRVELSRDTLYVRDTLTELQQSCNRAATELQQSCNRAASDTLYERDPLIELARARQSCNRAATELQQSCNRAATELQHAHRAATELARARIETSHR
jgi:hypothetical protein